MTFDLVNVFLRLILTGVLVYKITQFRDMANAVERIGFGFAGGSSFLTVANILAAEDSPFDGWAGMIFTAGVLMIVVGRTYRDRKHARRNEAMKEQAERWLATGRGK